MRQKNVIIIVGESGSGKSSVVDEIANKYGYSKILLYTTRPPRRNERHGVDYFFKSEEEFQELKECGFFVETSQYNGWNYGIGKNACDIGKKQDIVFTLTPKGLRWAKKIWDCTCNITSFYIKVPRRDRLVKILQRGDNIEEAYRRNLSEVGQFDGIEDEVDYIVENGNYEKSIEEIADEIMGRF